MNRYHLVIASLSYTDSVGQVFPGMIEIPVLNAHGAIVRTEKFTRHVSAPFAPLVVAIELEHGETFGKAHVVGAGEWVLEAVDAPFAGDNFYAPVAAAAKVEARGYWREQAQEAQAEAVELRADLADADRVIWGLSAIAIIGWGLTIALAAGWL